MVPDNIPNGNYIIRVKTIDNIVSDDSAIFSIIENNNQIVIMKPGNIRNPQQIINTNIMKITPKIAIAYPTQNDIINPKSVCRIKWKTVGLMLNKVRIQAIFVKTGALYSIAYVTENDGEYDWNLSKTFWTPGDYKIKIFTTDGGIVGLGKIFKIAAVISSNICKTGNGALDLECLINNYRKSLGLKSIPHSNSLEKVAKAHVKDLAAYHPENKCNQNTHSWSNNENWKGGCFDFNYSSTHGIMWYKPKEIAGDNSNGFEIACKGCSSAAGSLSLWKGSKGHNDVIINKGI